MATYSRKLGLVWAYGVAVWGYDLDEAREWVDRIFLALKGVLRGTYTQAVFRELTMDEAYVPLGNKSRRQARPERGER